MVAPLGRRSRKNISQGSISSNLGEFSAVKREIVVIRILGNTDISRVVTTKSP